MRANNAVRSISIWRSGTSRTALIRCVGPENAGIAEQRVELRRPSRLVIRRETEADLNWWYAGEPQRDENQLSWPDGTTLTLTRGSIVDIDPQGFLETKVHFAGMKLADHIRSFIPW